MKKKPVFEGIEHISSYLYYAQINTSDTLREYSVFLSSDSLNNLKQEIRDRGYRLAWISCYGGYMSYGQNSCNTIPFRPRYWDRK